MKFLLIIDSLGSGGAQRQMVTLAAGLAARGHHVEMFTYYDDGHFAHFAQRAGVVLHVQAKASRFSLQPVVALRNLFKQGRFDCALAFLETPSVYAELARLGRSGPPLVVSERFCYSPATLGWRGRLQQELHRLADWITVNSFHQKEVMVKMFPWMASRISVIWNGVDTDHFATQPLPVPVEGKLRVQVLASLASKKNPLGLAKAVGLCRDEYGLLVEVNWAGVQTVSAEGGKARQDADAFLKAHNLADQWCWTGEVRDVRPLLADCDVAVHPSFAEGLPNALCEALSCGRPVLASNIGDHALLVDGGANGALFDPSSPSAIAAALYAHSMLSEDERIRKAASARRYAEMQLSRLRYVDAYESKFAALLKGSKK
ncbi:glycosyltransferase family 4 protein [Thermomonas sp. RSS23]|uniref:Glycosyltransferase family 4 protein n=1 Tax=Thermomonas beijingensis TaxID=2872701 RepID=A0ABS7TCL5_9GAMM|nr:glycosyltransferase family 4 protein [Thermomonas beijingensis]MBZ4185592.1 glycosyltransferase family 4 protein [Thermomonas beijingensis]